MAKRASRKTSTTKSVRDERRPSGTLELIPHSAWCAAPDGRLTFCNDHWLKSTGLAREHAKGLDWSTVLHPDDATRVQQIWRSALAGGTAAEAEARMRTADGSYRWHLIRAIPQFARAGRLLNWYGTATDIHDRKLVEEALRETEAKWRSVFDSSAIGVAVTDMTGRFLWVNPTYERFLAYSQEELRQFRFIDVTHEAFRTHNSDLIKECLDGKRRQFQIEKLYRRKDGVPVWVRNNVSIIRDQSGAPQFIMALAEDIMLQRLASIVEEQYDFLAIADLEGRPLYVNRSGQKLVGLDSAEELRDMEAMRYFFPEDWPSMTQTIKKSILPNGFWSGEMRFRHLKTGKSVPVFYQGFRIDDPETGDPNNIAILCRDIAARKEAERAAQAAQTELARVNRLTTMGEMAASIAHEINQPLTAIIANGEASLRFLAFQPPDLGNVREALRSIIDDASRAAEITGGIRNMAKRSQSERSPINVNEVIDKVLSLTRGETGIWDVAVRTELKVALPSVIADRVQLQQVVLNLIMNAIEAMVANKDGPRRLEISTNSEEAGVLVSVKDSGTGLESGNAQRIFEPFFTTKASGVGLGLSICRSIIESHGGRLWATPAEPCGAVFQFTLPSE